MNAKQAFTLIELLTTVAIAALLSALIFAAVSFVTTDAAEVRYDAFVLDVLKRTEELVAVDALSGLPVSDACVGSYPDECNGDWNSTSGVLADLLVLYWGQINGLYAPDMTLGLGGVSMAIEGSSLRLAIYVGAESSRCEEFRLDRSNWTYIYA